MNISVISPKRNTPANNNADKRVTGKIHPAKPRDVYSKFVNWSLKIFLNSAVISICPQMIVISMLKTVHVWLTSTVKPSVKIFMRGCYGYDEFGYDASGVWVGVEIGVRVDVAAGVLKNSDVVEVSGVDVPSDFSAKTGSEIRSAFNIKSPAAIKCSSSFATRLISIFSCKLTISPKQNTLVRTSLSLSHS